MRCLSFSPSLSLDGFIDFILFHVSNEPRHRKEVNSSFSYLFEANVAHSKKHPPKKCLVASGIVMLNKLLTSYFVKSDSRAFL